MGKGTKGRNDPGQDSVPKKEGEERKTARLFCAQREPDGEVEEKREKVGKKTKVRSGEQDAV